MILGTLHVFAWGVVAVKRVLSIIIGVTLLVGCGDSGTPKIIATLPLKECRAPRVENALKCATLSVFENRDRKQGRKIDIHIVVAEAVARNKEPDPIFIFAGGPGQAASDLVSILTPALRQLMNKRDVVFIDQRGTGKSNPLNCTFPREDTPEMADPVKRRALTIETVSKCRDNLAQKADLTQYTTTIAMGDIDEVRAALGYETINLWGASYGTRAAQEYLRRYPTHVRTMTIDGVAPPSLILPESFARDAGAAIEAMFVACETSAICKTSSPNLRRDFATLGEALEKSPKRVTLKDPVTGIPRDVTLTKAGLHMAVFTTLYVPQMAAMVPEAIKAAKDGDFAPLLAVSSLFGESTDKIAIGMRFSVSCAEDVARIDDPMRAAAAKVAPFGDSFIREFTTGCEPWPRGKVPDDFFTPVKSDKPVLIFSGGLDPVTPPSWGEVARKGFPNSLHAVAPHIGHGVTHQGCAPKILKQFIETASVVGLDASCLARMPRPSFYQAMKERPTNEDVK